LIWPFYELPFTDENLKIDEKGNQHNNLIQYESQTKKNLFFTLHQTFFLDFIVVITLVIFLKQAELNRSMLVIKWRGQKIVELKGFCFSLIVCLK